VTTLNVIMRASGRPRCLHRAVASVGRQSYPSIRLIIGCDDRRYDEVYGPMAVTVRAQTGTLWAVNERTRFPWHVHLDATAAIWLVQPSGTVPAVTRLTCGPGGEATHRRPSSGVGTP
jgi:hypothetical protein